MIENKEYPLSKKYDFDYKTNQYIHEITNTDIPEELKNQWLELLEESDDETTLEKTISEIRRKIEARKHLNSTKFAPTEEEYYFENNTRLTEKVKKIVEDTISGKCKKIGKGMSASVYPSEKYPELCYKIIENSEEYKKSCNVREEMEFLDNIHELNVAGVRVPRPYCYYMSSKIHMCVMERLNAATLQEIIENKYSLPENFNIENQFKNLKEFFQIMHNKYNIRHGDFHSGNIMFDLEDGTIYIIDFGKSFKAFSSDGYTHEKNGKSVIALNDEEQIQKLYIDLKTFIRNRDILDKK